jgi:hypothetical protein
VSAGVLGLAVLMALSMPKVVQPVS